MAATRSEGAAIHPAFLRIGPWAMSIVVAALFALAFATSYAALYDYALQLGFDRPFAIAFPLVLDAVISVLAVVLLLERALGRRVASVWRWQVTLHLPSWPMLALWLYFAGSVAGNVGHAPPMLEARLVAAVPPVSAMLTFHLLLRLLDRAATLRSIAETFEEQRLEAAERAAQRMARRAKNRAQGEQSSAVPAPTAPDSAAPIERRARQRRTDSAADATPAAPGAAAPNGHGAAPRLAPAPRDNNQDAPRLAPAPGAGAAEHPSDAPRRSGTKSNGAPRGSQLGRAWALYDMRRGEGLDVLSRAGVRQLNREIEEVVGCSPGQSRKLRSLCEGLTKAWPMYQQRLDEGLDVLSEAGIRQLDEEIESLVGCSSDDARKLRGQCEELAHPASVSSAATGVEPEPAAVA